MNSLYSEYHNDGAGLEIIAAPCNQFGGQEPGTPAQILSKLNDLGVKFVVTEKLNVKGSDRHPLYDFLASTPNYSQPGWNFGMYFLIDGAGNVVRVHKGAPEGLAEHVEALLDEQSKL